MLAVGLERHCLHPALARHSSKRIEDADIEIGPSSLLSPKELRGEFRSSSTRIESLCHLWGNDCL